MYFIMAMDFSSSEACADISKKSFSIAHTRYNIPLFIICALCLLALHKVIFIMYGMDGDSM